jgi:hypothetical protein
MVWINHNTPAAARVLVVGDARGFGLERPFRATSALDVDWFLWVVKKSADEEIIARTLGAAGFTHILLNPAEMARVGPRGSLTPAEFQRAARFWAFYTEQLFEDGTPASNPPRWSLVYRLVPRRAVPTDGPIPWMDVAARSMTIRSVEPSRSPQIESGSPEFGRVDVMSLWEPPLGDESSAIFQRRAGPDLSDPARGMLRAGSWSGLR